MLTILFALLQPAHAVVIAGNPELVVQMDYAGETVDAAYAYIETVTLTPCSPGAQHTITVNEQADLADSWRVAVPAGDWCDVQVAWSAGVVLQGNNTQGAWTISVDADSATADVDPGDGTVSVSSSLVQGVVIAGNPELIVAFE